MANLKEIGGRTFAFGKLSPAEAVPVAWKLLPVLPGLMRASSQMGGAIAGVAKDAAGAEAPTVAAMARAVGQLSDEAQLATLIDAVTGKIDGDEVVRMMRTMFKSVQLVVGQSAQTVDIDLHFGEGLNIDMFKVFAEALRVNFAGFLGGIRSPSSPDAQVT